MCPYVASIIIIVVIIIIKSTNQPFHSILGNQWQTGRLSVEMDGVVVVGVIELKEQKKNKKLPKTQRENFYIFHKKKKIIKLVELI